MSFFLKDTLNIPYAVFFLVTRVSTIQKSWTNGTVLRKIDCLTSVVFDRLRKESHLISLFLSTYRYKIFRSINTYAFFTYTLISTNYAYIKTFDYKLHTTQRNFEVSNDGIQGVFRNSFFVLILRSELFICLTSGLSHSVNTFSRFTERRLSFILL